MEPSDIELVMKAKTAGDDRAFAFLVRRHQARLRAFLRRLSGDGALADDLAQDAFLRAHAGLDGFRGGGSFRSWLYSIAYREFLQHCRKATAERRMMEAAQDAAGQDAAAPMADANLSLDLQAALLQLSEMERAAVLFCDAAGLSHAEAAAAMDAPLGSVKTYVARARLRLREILTPDQPLNSAAPDPVKGVCHAR